MLEVAGLPLLDDDTYGNLALRADDGAVLAPDGDAGETSSGDGLEGILDLV